MDSSLSSLSEVPSRATDYAEHQGSLQQRLNLYRPVNQHDDTVAFLKAVNKHLPLEGSANLVDDAVCCQTDGDLKRLAESIDVGMLRPMKAVSGKTPRFVSSPRLGVEDSIDNLEDLIADPVEREQEALRRDCLKRDGNKCVVSGFYNVKYSQVPSGGKRADLIAAHILPFSLGTFRTDDERRQTSAIWTNIYRYFPYLRNRLGFFLENLNDPRNVMMLESVLHDQFGSFLFALESTETEHQYRIKLFSGFPDAYEFFLPSSGMVTFTSQDNRFRLPEPGLLAIHAAIAKILHATGRGEIVDKILRDYKATRVLSRDGRSDISGLLSISQLSLMDHPSSGSKVRAAGNENAPPGTSSGKEREVSSHIRRKSLQERRA